MTGNFEVLEVGTKERLAKAEADRAELLAALGALLREPHGCAFCHSGKPIRSVRTGDLCDHEAECGFAMARAAIAKAEGSK